MTSNVNFSATRKAMDAFQSALESLDIILCDENIFTIIEYSLIDPQMKMWYTSILVKLVKNTKSNIFTMKYREILVDFKGL